MLDIIVGIILLIAAIFLTVAILMQEGKSYRLSGAIAGGADTFFGKTKGKAISKKLSSITTIVAICFTAVVLVLYILQPNGNKVDQGQIKPADPDAKTSEKTSDKASGKTSEKASEKTSEKTSAEQIASEAVSEVTSEKAE